jgi:hypothetical protein
VGRLINSANASGLHFHTQAESKAMKNNEPHPDDLHSDQNVTSRGLPADDPDGLAEWVDSHNPPMSEAELDALFVALMERRDALRAVAIGRIAAVDAVLGVIRPSEPPKPAA